MFVYLRFLLYLRIFSSMSWLLRMIVACFMDMLTFLFIFILSIFAFADSFESINKKLKISQLLDSTDSSIFDSFV